MVPAVTIKHSAPTELQLQQAAALVASAHRMRGEERQAALPCLRPVAAHGAGVEVLGRQVQGRGLRRLIRQAAAAVQPVHVAAAGRPGGVREVGQEVACTPALPHVTVHSPILSMSQMPRAFPIASQCMHRDALTGLASCNTCHRASEHPLPWSDTEPSGCGLLSGCDSARCRGSMRACIRASGCQLLRPSRCMYTFQRLHKVRSAQLCKDHTSPL